MKNFILFSLPRTGSKMLVNGLRGHSQVHKLAHEYFREMSDQSCFDRFCGIHVNPGRHKPWMLEANVPRIMITREDYVAGALSVMFLQSTVSASDFDVPVDAVQFVAQRRYDLDQQLRPHCDAVFSYEALTKGGVLTEVPSEFVSSFSALTNRDVEELPITREPNVKRLPRNVDEIREALREWRPE